MVSGCFTWLEIKVEKKDTIQNECSDNVHATDTPRVYGRKDRYE